MSDEFFRVARQEIQAEIDSLNEILYTCVNDEHIHKQAKEIAKHMHKIKGLAPMMEQERLGEIARICDIILKHVANNGILKGSHAIISDAVDRMSGFGRHATILTEDFGRQVKEAYPHISEF